MDPERGGYVMENKAIFMKHKANIFSLWKIATDNEPQMAFCALRLATMEAVFMDGSEIFRHTDTLLDEVHPIIDETTWWQDDMILTKVMKFKVTGL